MWVLRKDRIKYRIRNLVGDLVGVTFGHAFRSKCPVTTHDGSVSSLSVKEVCSIKLRMQLLTSPYLHHDVE